MPDTFSEEKLVEDDDDAILQIEDEEDDGDFSNDTANYDAENGIDLAQKRRNHPLGRGVVCDPTQLYLGEIGFTPLLTAEEEVHFARLALKGDAAARKRMIESNLRLVVKI